MVPFKVIMALNEMVRRCMITRDTKDLYRGGVSLKTMAAALCPPTMSISLCGVLKTLAINIDNRYYIVASPRVQHTQLLSN